MQRYQITFDVKFISTNILFSLLILTIFNLNYFSLSNLSLIFHFHKYVDTYRNTYSNIINIPPES